MKVSLNLAQAYSNVDLKSIPRDELLQRIGAQLGAVEDVKDYVPRYNDIVIVKVVECGKHPDADKLSLCRIDDGGVVPNVERDKAGLVQVVCGAPNVRTGMFAVWIPPGATVPSTLDNDPFVLEARELRDKISNGMLASPSELDISDDHDGILEIIESEVGRDPKLGEPITNFFGLDDFVVDCENKMFTHRPDCFGNLGVARELAGIFGLKFESPEWYLAPLSQIEDRGLKIEDGGLQLEVGNEIPELVPRFMAVAMKNVKVGKSNIHTQALLKRVGIKPINNIVDVTNYVMHLTGQPLHAFDYDKLVAGHEGLRIEPRLASEGEEITLLGGKTIKLIDKDLVISANGKAVSIAGVMGGADTEVDENTKNIVIECANFDMYTIRRTSMRHGLFTDAVTRFNKGQSPLQNDRVLAFAMQQMSELVGAEQASSVFDTAINDEGILSINSGKHPMYGPEDVDIEFINERLGSSLNAQEICDFLVNVEFEAFAKSENVISYWAPFWRMDILIAEDIVEEVGRLYGYDKLPVLLPARLSKPNPKNPSRDFKQTLRDTLSRAGANEVLTYSFVHGKILENSNISPDKSAYHLRNALSPDLQYYRPSLVPSLLAKIHSNIKSQAGSDENIFALFEIGRVHIKNHFEESEPTLPKQMNRISFVIAADSKYQNANAGSAYYQAKKYVDLITNNQAVYEPLDTNEYPLTAPYQMKRSAIILIGEDKKPVGVVGEFQSSVSRAFKLPEYCAGFEIDTDFLREYIQPASYQPLSQYPSSIQDITFEAKPSIRWGQVYDLVHAELAVAKAESGYEFIVEPLDIYQAEGSNVKRYSIRITLTHHHKTLKTEEVNKLLEDIAKAMYEEYKATRI